MGTRGLLLGIVGASTLLAQTQGGTFADLLRRGFDEHRQQRYVAAIPILERARALRPSDATVNLLLGIDHLRIGNPRRALPYLEEAHRADPRNPLAQGYAAEAYADLGEFDRTAEILHGVMQAGGSADARYALIQFYLRRFTALAGALRTTSPGLAYAYRLQAMAQQGQGGTKEHDALAQALRLWPRFPGIHAALGWEALRRGDFSIAASEFDAALSADGNDLEALAGRAVLASHAGRPDDSVRLLKIVGLHSRHVLARFLDEWPASEPKPPSIPQQPVSRAGAAVELFHEHRWEALRNRLSAGNCRPQEDYWLGVALASLDEFATAIPPLERARRANVHQLECAYWLSLCYAKAADQESNQLRADSRERALALAVEAEGMLRLARNGPVAASRFERAVELSPSDPALWTGLAEAELLAGDTAKAREAAERALRLDPHRLVAMKVSAEAVMQERDYNSAIPMLKGVLAVQPGDLAATVLLGTAYSRTGSHALAVRHLDDALRAGYPDEKGSLHYLLGNSLRSLGREKEAAAALDQAARLSEAFASAGHAAEPEKKP